MELCLRSTTVLVWVASPTSLELFFFFSFFLFVDLLKGWGQKESFSRIEYQSAVYQSNQMAPASRHLWVGNLPHSINEGDLVDLFSRFGDITRIAFPPGRSYAFIDLGRTDEAIAAMKALDGFLVAGNPLRVEFTKVVSLIPNLCYSFSCFLAPISCRYVYNYVLYFHSSQLIYKGIINCASLFPNVRKIHQQIIDRDSRISII